jgi:hypothetical protein
LEDEILNKIRGLLLPVTGKKILVGGVLLVLLIVAVAAMASPSNSGGATSTVTPTPASTVAPTAEATATPAAPKATSKPTATPKPSNTLTQAQLTTLDSGMAAKGYTITQPLHYDHIASDGATVYSGKMEKSGVSYNYEWMIYKDAASADNGFDTAVNTLQTMGFSGTYDSINQWTGTMLYNGSPVGGSAVESADSAPYGVAVVFAAE